MFQSQSKEKGRLTTPKKDSNDMILSKGRLIDKVVRRGRLKSNKASLFTGSSIMQSNGLILLCPGSFLVIT